MGPPPVLRKWHTLEGKNILPIIKKMRSHEGGGPVTMARLRMNETIEQLTEDELRSNFKRLTGDTTREILEMAGKEDTRDNMEVLLHYTILHANEIGQPSGQDLSEVVEEHVEPPPKKRCNSDTSMLEKRIKELEEQQKQEKTSAMEEIKDKVSSVGVIDLLDIDNRLNTLDERVRNSKNNRKRDSLKYRFVTFLSQLPHSPNLDNVGPKDVCRFLVWSDHFGKTQIHGVFCKFLGRSGVFECGCPLRLAAGSLRNLISQLSDIFKKHGRGHIWDISLNKGNPCMAPSVQTYEKSYKEELARARIVPKQAKPLFLNKIKTMSKYIDRELQSDLTLREKYVLARDQALFKLQFFAGDRASDMTNILPQEVKQLSDGSGYVFSHTYGKTLRGDGRCNTFAVKKCQDHDICPVRGLEFYYNWSRLNGVDLSVGYLFRPVLENGRVLDDQLCYSAIYERLKGYLATLGIDEGETPHSLRGGFAVSMSVSRTKNVSNDLMKHVGWASERSAHYYSRASSISEASVIADNVASMSANDNVQEFYRQYGDYSILRNAFEKNE